MSDHIPDDVYRSIMEEQIGAEFWAEMDSKMARDPHPELRTFYEALRAEMNAIAGVRAVAFVIDSGVEEPWDYLAAGKRDEKVKRYLKRFLVNRGYLNEPVAVGDEKQIVLIHEMLSHTICRVDGGQVKLLVPLEDELGDCEIGARYEWDQPRVNMFHHLVSVGLADIDPFLVETGAFEIDPLGIAYPKREFTYQNCPEVMDFIETNVGRGRNRNCPTVGVLPGTGPGVGLAPALVERPQHSVDDDIPF